jgi:type IV secretion system protein VirB9
MILTARAMRRFHKLAALLASASLIGGCTSVRAQTSPTPQATPPLVAATRTPPEPVQIVKIPTPLPLPGQLKPLETARAKTEPAEPRRRVEVANDAARIQPDGTSWLNAIQQYPYSDGALYQVYAAPGQVTDIALQEGEELAGPGPVAAGDTVRWIIGDTASGSGTTKRVHILVKPTRPDLTTNLVINTDRRTYHLELRAGVSTYMAAVSWTYPQDQLIALRAANAEHERAAPVASGIDIGALNFGYRIDGDKPAWRPVRAFDDGRQAYIEFPETIATGEMPPLFVTGADGSAELVNYRAQGRFMIVDRLFSAAELRLGTKKSEQRVRIERDDASARRRRS